MKGQSALSMDYIRTWHIKCKWLEFIERGSADRRLFGTHPVLFALKSAEVGSPGPERFECLKLKNSDFKASLAK